MTARLNFEERKFILKCYQVKNYLKCVYIFFWDTLYMYQKVCSMRV